MFMGRTPQQAAQNIQQQAGAAPYGHPKNPDGGTNAMKTKGSKPSSGHDGPVKGVQNMRYLDQNPKMRDGRPKPGFQEEFAKAVKERDVGMISELLCCITDNEAPAVHSVILRVLKDGKADDCAASLEALLDHKMPKFHEDELAQLIFESLRVDQEPLARHFATACKYDARDMAVQLDKCVMSAKLPGGDRDDDPMLQRLDVFIAEEMPRVEKEINKHMQEQEERAVVDKANGGAPIGGGKAKFPGEGEGDDDERYGDDENGMQYQRTLNWRDTVDDDAEGGTGYADADEIDPNAPSGDLVEDDDDKSAGEEEEDAAATSTK